MICLEDVSVRAGSFSLEGIGFEVPTRAYAVLMGKSGSGKTTLLEAICGLNTDVDGRVVLMNRAVTHVKPAERGIGYVPQDGALFSQMCVREHLSFALRIRKRDADAIENRVAELGALLGIQHLLDRMPRGLSGGELQRVALGRALSHAPPVLCLDEPLSALDEDTRVEMYGLLKSVQAYTGVTVLHVTHNTEEAKHLADCLLVLKDGQVQTVDTEDFL